MPPNNPDLPALLAAVEQACGSYSLALTVRETSRSTRAVIGGACALSDTLRAARERGGEAVRTLRQRVACPKCHKVVNGKPTGVALRPSFHKSQGQRCSGCDMIAAARPAPAKEQ